MIARLVLVSVFGGIASLLSGCMAVPVAMVALGGTNIYNQLNPEKNVTVDIDPAGLGRMREQLKSVNHLAILANNTSALSFSDVWEKAGKQASIITSQTDPASISLSQARGALASACRPGVHASAYGRAGDVDVNRMGLILGKAQAKIEADLYVFNCRTKKLDSSPLTISFNAMGQDGNQTDRSIGAGLASKLLEIAQN